MLTAKLSTWREGLEPSSCVGLVAGHLAGTGTDQKASSTLPVEKQYARGKDRHREQRRLAVWMRGSCLGATCADTERGGPASSSGMERRWVISTKLGWLFVNCAKAEGLVCPGLSRCFCMLCRFNSLVDLSCICDCCHCRIFVCPSTQPIYCWWFSYTQSNIIGPALGPAILNLNVKKVVRHW